MHRKAGLIARASDANLAGNKAAVANGRLEAMMPWIAERALVDKSRN